MINVIGAGSLGSFCVFLLAKMIEVLKCQIRVIDFDKVELRNVQNQLYRVEDVGELKIVALRDIISNTFNVEILTEASKVDEKTDLRGIVVVLVDNMETRKKIFESCKFNSSVDYLIDARTGIGGAMVFALDPKDRDWVARYQVLLYPDSETEPLPCATPETVPTLWAVAAVIAKLIVNFKSEPVFTNGFYQCIIDFTSWPSVIDEVRRNI